MKDRKYSISKEPKDSRTFYGVKLRRIIAMKDFGDVKAGDKGGFVETYANLSQSGKCWIYGDAMANGKSFVSEDAIVTGTSQLKTKVMVAGSAVIRDSSIDGNHRSNYVICGHAVLNGGGYYHNVESSGFSGSINGGTDVSANCGNRAEPSKFSRVLIGGNATFVNGAWFLGEGEKIFHGNAVVHFATFHGECDISGDAEIPMNAQIPDSAAIHSKGDVIVVKDFLNHFHFTYINSRHAWSTILPLLNFTGDGSALAANLDSFCWATDTKKAYLRMIAAVQGGNPDWTLEAWD